LYGYCVSKVLSIRNKIAAKKQKKRYCSNHKEVIYLVM
jgi:hypothetical protein